MGVAWRRVFATEPLWDILVCSIWKGPSGGFRVGDTHNQRPNFGDPSGNLSDGMVATSKHLCVAAPSNRHAHAKAKDSQA